MCGIFGIVARDANEITSEKIEAMSSSILYRGPDNVGFIQKKYSVIGNCRLSIIDPSETANQPMTSEDNKIALVQNGEIYNFIELRDELIKLGCKFQTASDTEVLLRAYEIWGPKFVNRLNGMFAIAIYDYETGILRLYRDRLGVKPLYFYLDHKGKIVFASEIKAILAAGIDRKPNLDAIAQYLALNYIPQPETIFEGIFHLSPGHMATFETNQGLELKKYWDLADVQPDDQMTEAEAKSELLKLLDDATRIRMRSDAKFGAFLSGGLDSSAVVGMMSLYQSESINTYSIGFNDKRFDETEFALKAAKRFGTTHQVQIMPENSAARWPKFIWHCDQPHGDISFMPTDQISEFASKDVKMVLTGDGGDELFAGYEKYLSLFPNGQFDHLKTGWEQNYVESSGLLQGRQPNELLKRSLHSAFFDKNPYLPLSSAILEASHQDPINQVLLAETKTLLPGNNLVKPDRMAMANSLEVRSPFLDYRLAEFAFRVPGNMKLANGETKSIYKRAVEPLLGHELTYRKKQMFTVPIGEWFRDRLANYCRSILLDGRLESRNLVDTSVISNMIKAHISGAENNTRQLRALISLELWYRLYIDEDQEALQS